MIDETSVALGVVEVVEVNLSAVAYSNPVRTPTSVDGPGGVVFT